jgi:hypothetical protein
MDFLGNELFSLEALLPVLVLIFIMVLTYMVKESAKTLKSLLLKMKERPIRIEKEEDLSLKIAKEREALRNLRKKIEGED